MVSPSSQLHRWTEARVLIDTVAQSTQRFSLNYHFCGTPIETVQVDNTNMAPIDDNDEMP
jgi:hypothetical protein